MSPGCSELRDALLPSRNSEAASIARVGVAQAHTSAKSEQKFGSSAERDEDDTCGSPRRMVPQRSPHAHHAHVTFRQKDRSNFWTDHTHKSSDKKSLFSEKNKEKYNGKQPWGDSCKLCPQEEKMPRLSGQNYTEVRILRQPLQWRFHPIASTSCREKRLSRRQIFYSSLSRRYCLHWR